MQTILERVTSVLEEGDFKRVPTPMRMKDIEFPFEAALIGDQHSHDLVLIATQDMDAARLKRLVSGIGRVLDLVQSRRPITLVYIGQLDTVTRVEIERFCRVLVIPNPQPTQEEIRRGISVLLPLSLPNDKFGAHYDPLDKVAGILADRITSEHRFLIDSAAGGSTSVRAVLQEYLNQGAELEKKES